MTRIGVTRGARPILGIFAKEPCAGYVKTRMSPPLTPEQAARFYGCMLDDVLHAMAQVTEDLELDGVLLVDPASALAEMANRTPASLRIVAQRGADLSERMEWAAAACAATGAPFFLLRGSDSPALPPRCIADAIEALETRCDFVVSPDADGGYNLVGMRRYTRHLFDHRMSTTDVLANTLANAKYAGYGIEMLPHTFDLDCAEDLSRLAGVAREDEWLCRRTTAFIAENESLRELFLTS